MNASTEGFTPGSMLLQYRLDNRLGRLPSSNVWRATDTRGRTVAIKILSRSLPREKAKRDAYIREVKVAAAVHHPNLATIHDVSSNDDTLFMVMELLEGTSVSDLARKELPGRTDLLKYTWQATEALNAIQSRGTIHGRVNADNLIVTPDGRLRVCGLGMASFGPRHTEAIELSANSEDISWISFLAPEQIIGRPLDARTDFFSLGVVLYLMATGQLPFQARNVTDLANQIVKSAAQAPQAVNPRIDLAPIGIIGKCLYKEPSMRYSSAKALLDDIKKLDTKIQALAAPPASPIRTAVAEQVVGGSTLYVAELPYHELLRKKNPEKAARLEALMQQILGEAVYLFDGQVIDSMGPRMIAQLPDATAAVAAARKGQADLAEHNASVGADGDVLEPRSVLHSGEVNRSEGGTVSGPAVDLALGVLASLEPLQLLVSEPVFREAKFPRNVDPAGSFSDVRFFQLPPEKPKVVEPPPEPVPVVEAAEVAAPVEKRPPFLLIGVGIAAVLAIALAVLLFRPRGQAPAAVPVKAVAAVPQTPRVLLQPFTVESAVSSVGKTAPAARRAALAILETLPGIEVAAEPQRGVLAYGATIRTGTAGPEMIPTADGSPLGTGPIPMTSTGAAVVQLIERIARDTKVAAPALNADAVTNFITALDNSGSASRPELVRAAASLKAAIQADPSFLAAQRTGVDLFERAGEHPAAMEAARQVMALDPADQVTAQKLAEWYKQSGDPVAALDVYASILHTAPDDRQALTAIGKYALSAGDNATFTRVLQKLPARTDGSAQLFAPDILLATGRIDAAAQKYYDNESADPANAALSLTIGRVAVLRRSLPIAAIEIGKLEKLDPAYGSHLLKAYVEAQNGRSSTALAELSTAAAAPRIGPEFYTSSAEVYTLLNQPGKALESLKKAVDRSEPTASYSLANPIFRYLHTDPAWGGLRSQFEAQKSAVAARLGTITL